MPYRVFIADSSPSALKALHLVFQESGYDLYTADSGEAVMDSILQINPDAVVLGLSLPQRDGYELARELRTHDGFQEVPLILLRGVYEEVDEERLQGCVYSEIVDMPFDSEELAYKIRSLIGETREPVTFPEELELPEDSEPDARASPVSEKEDAAFDERVKARIKREFLEMERELEKRIAARVKAELKDWVLFDLPGDKDRGSKK